MGAFCTHFCPFSSLSSSFTSNSLQSWTQSVSRNASENAWKRSTWRSRKTPVRPREPRVAAVSDFPGTAGRVPTGIPKIGRCAAVRERWRKMLVLARTAAGKAACGKCRKTLKMVKIGGFWTLRRESRINGWRRNRRFSCSQQPAVRTVSRGCAGAAIGACLEKNKRGWHQKSRKRRRFKGFWRAAPQIGGL